MSIYFFNTLISDLNFFNIELLPAVIISIRLRVSQIVYCLLLVRLRAILELYVTLILLPRAQTMYISIPVVATEFVIVIGSLP